MIAKITAFSIIMLLLYVCTNVQLQAYSQNEIKISEISNSIDNELILYYNLELIQTQIDVVEKNLENPKIAFEHAFTIHTSIYPKIKDNIDNHYSNVSNHLELLLTDFPFNIKKAYDENLINKIILDIQETRTIMDDIENDLKNNYNNSELLLAQVTLLLLNDAYESYSNLQNRSMNSNEKILKNEKDFFYLNTIGFLERSKFNYNQISKFQSNNTHNEILSFYNQFYNGVINKEDPKYLLQNVNAINANILEKYIVNDDNPYFSKINSLLMEIKKEIQINKDYKKADKLAIEAYLDNYEYLEAAIEEEDPKLMTDIEILLREDLRKLIKNNEDPETIENLINEILPKLNVAEKLVNKNHILDNQTNENKGQNLANINELAKGFGTFSGMTKKMGEAEDPLKSMVRENIDQIQLKLQKVLKFYKDKQFDDALTTSKSAYLDSYENIEIPLRPINPDFTLEMEIKFAELRNLLQKKAPYEEVQQKITEISRGLDESERLVSGTGILAPSIAFSSSFSIIFREGLESALIIGAILTYLDASRNDRYKRHIYYGIILAIAATAITWIFAQYIIGISGANRDLIEAIAGVSAVAVLFWVSFWILNKIETKKWIEFVKAKVWKAATTGSIMVFIMLSFFTIYREGFETVLFYQAMMSFAKYMEWYVVAGLVLGLAVIVGIAIIIRKLGKKLPLRVLFGLTMGIGAYMSITFIGNAVREFQEIGYISTTHLFGIIPRLDINLASMTGIHPTLETTLAQIILLVIYLIGSLYVLIIQPRRKKQIESARKSMSDLKSDP